MKEEITDYLKRETKFRERKNKDRGIVNLLIQRYPSLETIQKEILIDAVKDYNSMDRLWRLALSEDESLRGSDYNQKEELSQKKQLDLGYILGFEESIKALNRL